MDVIAITEKDISEQRPDKNLKGQGEQKEIESEVKMELWGGADQGGHAWPQPLLGERGEGLSRGLREDPFPLLKDHCFLGGSDSKLSTMACGDQGLILCCKDPEEGKTNHPVFCLKILTLSAGYSPWGSLERQLLPPPPRFCLAVMRSGLRRKCGSGKPPEADQSAGVRWPRRHAQPGVAAEAATGWPDFLNPKIPEAERQGCIDEAYDAATLTRLRQL